MVPPNTKLSGLTVNPLVKKLQAGQSTLVSVKYTSKFRDLTSQALQNKDVREDEAATEEGKAPAGSTTKNKKLAEKLAKKKTVAADAAPADPKKKGAPPAKKEEPAKKEAKGAKGGPTEEELAAEAERARQEALEAERRRLEEIEKNFDKHGELKLLGGQVTDFDVEDENMRTQHYDWLIPVYYKNTERFDGDIGCMYL